MIHYVCDGCKRSLGADETRYVVRMEVYAAPDDADAQLDVDGDHLAEIGDYLERLDHGGNPPGGDEDCRQLRFDLCDACRKSFLLDPLGRRVSQSLGFSKN